MRENRAKFIKILKAELEDLSEDIKSMEMICQKKNDDRIITDYVCKENMALFRKELSAIEEFVRSIDKVVIERYANLDEMIADISERFREKWDASAFPNAAFDLISRRIEKVHRYIIEE